MTQFNHLTKTAYELWKDKRFVSRRIVEQYDYQSNLMMMHGIRSHKRCRELLISSEEVLMNLRKRLKELNNEN